MIPLQNCNQVILQQFIVDEHFRQNKKNSNTTERDSLHTPTDNIQGKQGSWIGPNSTMEEVSTYTSTQDNERKTTEVNDQVSTGIDELCVDGRIIATTVHEKQSQNK